MIDIKKNPFLICLVVVVLWPFRLWAEDPYAVLSDSNRVLTFFYDDQKAERGGLSIVPFNKVGFQTWYNQRESVVKAVFDPSFANCKSISSTAFWFFEMRNLVSIDGLEHLNTSGVKSMFSMFACCNSLTSLDVSHFDTHDVIIMAGMFDECTSLTSLDVSHFDTSGVSDMSYMFDQCSALTSLDVSHFDTENVISMERMFNKCRSLTSLDVSHFDTKNVTNMFSMFNECSGLTSLDVSHFNTGNVELMGSMFLKCSGLKALDVSHFDTGKVQGMSNMFDGCSGLTSLDVSNFNTENVSDMNVMFRNCSGLKSLDVSNFNTSKVTAMTAMFAYCHQFTSLDVSHFDTRNVTTMYCMFDGCKGLTSLDVSHFVTDSVTSMNCMFHNCSGLTSIDVSHFNTKLVSDMGYMFSGCSNLRSLDVSQFETDSVKKMDFMFHNCSLITSLDVSQFKTDSVITMQGMFYNCSGLKTLDVSRFATGKVTDMSFMFYKCSSLDFLDVASFDTRNVKTMESMFDDCSRLTTLDLTNFNTENVEDMYCMFYDCRNLTTIFAGEGWNTSNVVSNYGYNHIDGRALLFGNCTSLIGGKGTRYDINRTSCIYARIDKPGEPGYFSDKDDPYDPEVAEAEPYALLSDGNSVLTFYYNNKKKERGGLEVGPFADKAAWYGYGQKIGKVVFDESFAKCTSLTSTRMWFYGFSSLTSITGIEHLNMSDVTDIGYMFGGCSSLTSLDLSTFDIGKVKKMDSMFSGCNSLATILVDSDWNTESVTDGMNMFLGCTSLVGGNGTTYDASRTGCVYAKIDRPGMPGYFTDKNGSVVYVAETPVLSLDYATGALTIICATEGSTIHYAIGTGDKQDYAGPVMLTDNSTVRAWATAEGYVVSDVTTVTPIPNGKLANDTFTIVGPVTSNELLFLRNVLGQKVEHLDLAEATLTDGGLADEAFARMPLLIAKLPAIVDSTGARLFAGCRRLAAVEWNAATDLTAAAMEGIDNPNLLLYVGSDNVGRQAGIHNRVVSGIAQEIILSDPSAGSASDCNFFCSRPFTASHISYTHSYGLKSGFNECRGWETLALPFDVQAIRHEATGKTIIPFATSTGNLEERPFWLCELTQGGWREVARVEAYKPYIIAMPNNETYSDQYCLTGNVTFSADEAIVAPTVVRASSKGDSSFQPTTIAVEAGDEVFAIDADGSVFVAALREVRPFEAWRTTTQQGVRFLPVFDDMPSNITLSAIELSPQTTLYDLQGRRLNATDRKGVYIVNGRKVVVK